MAFSFGFSGDDIGIDIQDADTTTTGTRTTTTQADITTTTTTTAANSAFPVPGKPQLPPRHHPLPDILSQLPSKIAYDTLDVTLDDGSTISLPRRELWDVRMQLMAEEGHEDDDGGGDTLAREPGSGGGRGGVEEGLGQHDVKTGVYEGGFKSWESSVDLVKVLAKENHAASSRSGNSAVRVIELGCGTALPSLALFQWILATRSLSDRSPPSSSSPSPRWSFIVADYNPSVLQLVTLPNFILAWALSQRHTHPALRDDAEEDGNGRDEGHEEGGEGEEGGPFAMDGELELTPSVLAAFTASLSEHNITLCFLSGGWSVDFVDLIASVSSSQASTPATPAPSSFTLLLGAETIYSPFALDAFTQTMFSILRTAGQVQAEEASHLTPAAEALVAAKRLYFGVGGSLDDFVDKARAGGAVVTQMREEAEGVRRGVVRCVLDRGR